MFIHDAILEACLCGETAIPVNEFALTYKEMLKVDSQSNTSQLREEFQVMTHRSLYWCPYDLTHALTVNSNLRAKSVISARICLILYYFVHYIYQ